MVVHFKRHCNTYGSVASYVIGLLVRLSGGEYMIGLPALIHYPNYIELPVIVGKEHEIRPFEQLFPFRTLAMFLSLVSVVFFSWVSRVLFESGRLPAKYDFLRCVINIPEDAVPVEEPHEGEMAVMSSMEVIPGLIDSTKSVHQVVKYSFGELTCLISPNLLSY